MAEEKKPDFKGKKVLIIEDDESVSRVYKIKLEKEGIVSEIAMDGDEGLKKIKDMKPDVVILDLMIPKHDGFWILEQTKKDGGLPHTPVIVLSNLGQESDKQRAELLGATEYLVKTNISIKEVIDKVLTYLTK